MNNLKIAESHSNNRKLVAYCISKASLLAIIVNTFVIPAGLVSLVLMLGLPLQEAILPVVCLIPIGVILAITIDGMTLGSCARLRRTYEHRIEIKNKYAAIPNKETELLQMERSELDSLSSSFVSNWLFVVVFSAISIAMAEIFWHTLLSCLPTVVSWLMSSVFSITVSTTLIASELLKKQNEEVIHESVQAASFHKLAMKADAEEEALSILHDEYKNRVQKLKENTPLIGNVVEENVIQIYNDLLFDGEDVIQQRIEADNFARERAEQKRLDKVREQKKSLSLRTSATENANITHGNQIEAHRPDHRNRVSGPQQRLEAMQNEQDDEADDEQFDWLFRRVVATDDETDDAQILLAEDEQNEQQDEQEINPINLDSRRHDEPTGEPKTDPGITQIKIARRDNDVIKNARRIVRRNPKITAQELADKIGKSRAQAGRIKTQILAELVPDPA